MGCLHLDCCKWYQNEDTPGFSRIVADNSTVTSPCPSSESFSSSDSTLRVTSHMGWLHPKCGLSSKQVSPSSSETYLAVAMASFSFLVTRRTWPANDPTMSSALIDPERADLKRSVPKAMMSCGCGQTHWPQLMRPV